MSNILTKKSFFDGRKMWFFFAAVASIITAGVIFSVLSSVAKTDTYWIVKEGVTIQASEAIDPSSLVAVTVPSESKPQNALRLSDIQAVFGEDPSDDYYALYTLKSGDVITSNNAGSLVNFGEVEVESGKVYASFKTNPSDAVSGLVKQGSRIDIAVVYQIGQSYSAKFVLQNIQVMQVSRDIDGAASFASEEDGASVPIPVIYTVAVTPQEAAILAVANRYTIYVVLNAGSGTTTKDIGMTFEDLLGDLNFAIPVLPESGLPEPEASTNPDIIVEDGSTLD
jgi:Flp pilus assembly protein CpaB